MNGNVFPDIAWKYSLAVHSQWEARDPNFKALFSVLPLCLQQCFLHPFFGFGRINRLSSHQYLSWQAFKFYFLLFSDRLLLFICIFSILHIFMVCRCLQDSLKLNLCSCSHCPCGLEESPERRSVKNYLYFAILNESQPLFLLKIFSFPCFCGSTVLGFCSYFFLLHQMLEKTLESLLDCKEIQPVHPKGDQSWVFIGRTDAEAETPLFWPPDVKSWIIGKDPDAGKDWGQEEKGTTEDEMVGWHHWLNGQGLGGLQMLVTDREAWRAVVHGVTKSQTRLSNWTELIHLNCGGPHTVVHDHLLISLCTIHEML